jgi:hypothetical protein
MEYDGWPQVYSCQIQSRLSIWFKKGDKQMNISKEVKLADTHRQTATTMASSRRIALAAGVLYLLTFVSIPTLALYAPVHDLNYILGAGPDTPTLIGAVLEIIVALACIGTAVALYPVVKKQNEGVALGFVGARVLEAAAIFAGVACLLSVVTLRQAGVGVDGLITGQALVALYDRLSLVGQSLMPAMNALLLGSLLYRSRLVPRVLPVLGLIGAPLLIAVDIAILFGLLERVSPLAGISALPMALWEFSLGVWLVVKGFNSSAIASLATRTSNLVAEPLVP